MTHILEAAFTLLAFAGIRHGELGWAASWMDRYRRRPTPPRRPVPDLHTPLNTTQAMRSDTGRRHFLEESAAVGTDAIIYQEAQGQAELLTSDVIPARTACCTEQDLADLGIVLGPVVDGDPLFRQATLPPGWTRQAGESDLMSYLVDEHGHRRLSMFYKAAFYDRRASISFTAESESGDD